MFEKVAFTIKPEPKPRECVPHQHATRGYDVLLGSKVEVARVSMRAGLGHTNEEVEATFSAQRAAVGTGD